MKKISYAALAAAVMMALTGCGPMSSGNSDSRQAEKTAAESRSSPEDSGKAQSDSKKNPAHAAIGSNGAKAVTDVLLIPREEIDISRDVSFEDLYGRHVLHSGVVGLVGSPVEVSFNPAKVEGGKLVFVYDPDQLKGVRPDALMFLWYDEEEGFYRELEEGVLNTENLSMSIEIDKPGVYLLVNKYQWLNAWGAGFEDDGYEAGYDPSQAPISGDLWAEYETVGDIPELADEEYIRSCRQTDGSYLFQVSDPVQLASAVYFANCIGSGGENPVTIELTDDIDLDGYEWASMGWYTAGIEYDFRGAVIGNGHTIKNMYIESRTNSYSGFIGYSTECSIFDLNFENAYVYGRNPGIAIGYARNSYLVGCSVQGVTEGSEAGSVVGIDQSCSLLECTADVIANGEDVGDYLSGSDLGAARVAAEHEPMETLWLNDKNQPTRESEMKGSYTSSLGWLVKRDGVQVLHRNAENETSLPWQDYDVTSVPGHYEVALTAYVDGYYIPISNTVEYDVSWEDWIS